MRIIISNDHGAVALKRELAAWLRAQGHEVRDMGVNSEDRVDYPDITVAACEEFLRGGYAFGILLCGTGIGVSISANKVKGIRCALVHDSFTATMARAHNDANFIAMGGRVEYRDPPTAILAAYMDTSFEGGRHAQRVAKLAAQEC